MGMVIGIDVGGVQPRSSVYDNKLYSPLLVKANDPVASIFGAFGSLLT